MSLSASTKQNRFVLALVSVCAFFCVASPIFAQGLNFNSVNLNTGSGPAMVVPIDVNNTGYPGLVCSDFGFAFGATFGLGNGGGFTLSVFTNDGLGNLSFSATLPAGEDPVGVAVADVNGDGYADIICANAGNASLSVFTNNRAGGFVLQNAWGAGEGAVYVAAADVNGDGHVDLISANYQDATISILTNKGDGTFKTSATLSTGANTSPSCIAAADFNGDGSVDLVCALGTSTLLAFTNNGHGVFKESAQITIAGGPAGWVVGADVDGNGTVDLIVDGGGTNFVVLTNDGAGDFSLKSTAVPYFPTPYYGVGSFVAADINGDGKVDLVCPINGNYAVTYMEVLTNDGAGNFSSNTVAEVGTPDPPDISNYPNFVTAADFNGDGNMDIAVSCYGSALLTQFTQTGVPPKVKVNITSPANDAVIPAGENFQLDATAVSSSNIEVVIYYFDSTIFAASTNAPFGITIEPYEFPEGTHALQAEAFDSGGHFGWSPEVQINITPQKSSGGSGGPLTFSSSTLATGSGPFFVLPVDLNGDGHPDLVTANFGFYEDFFCFGSRFGLGTNLTAWINNGHGGFSSTYNTEVGPPSNIAGPSEPSSIAAADLNGDGKLELVSVEGYTPFYSILTNSGNGVYEQGLRPAPARGPISVAIADVNGDGKPDIITANNWPSGYSLAILTNGGNLSFSNETILPLGPFAPSCVVAADINGDGSIDLISANYGTCGEGNTLTVFTNDGKGDFTSNATITVGYGPVCLVAADVNGDGFPDLISANQDDYTLSVLLNDGHGNFALRSTIPVSNPSSLVATNLTGNGSIDLAVASSYVGEDYRGAVTIFLNDGHGDFSSNTIIYIGAPGSLTLPQSIAAADFNGDGKMDLVVANYATSNLTVLLQTTTQQKQPPPPPTPVVSITSPANNASISTAASFIIAATATPVKAISEVEFYIDGALVGTSTEAPYQYQVPAGSVAVGGHSLQAVAVNTAGVSATSAVVQVTLNTPGTSLIDFDTLNTSAGAVGGTILANYLAQYGVTLANVTVGTATEAVNAASFTGSVQVQAPSTPNIFTQAGLNQPVSFTLRFATNLQAFGFTRAALSSSSGLVSHPKWTATTFAANGTQLSSVTEGLILTSNPVAQKSFVLTGAGIAYVTFSSDSQNTAAFSAVLLDNLLLDYNSVTPALSVALSVVSPATNDIIAPATITLGANVSDQLSGTYSVSFFAGANLLGTVSSSPYQLTVFNVLYGNYSLQARAVDSTGIAALSPVVPITVQLEPFSTLVNFDASTLNASKGPVEGAALKNYLAGFGISVSNVSPGTALAVESQQAIAGGKAVMAPSPPNILTQVGSSGPVQFTLHFSTLLREFDFTRPALLANPYVSHPAWQVTAFDGAGGFLGQVQEGEIDSSTNVGAREFYLGRPVVNGNFIPEPGIASVQFSSEGTGLTTFNAMLVDNLILVTNNTGFPPGVVITSPLTGVVLPRPPALTISAAAYDAAGIASVSFYANGILLATDTNGPYTVQWIHPIFGNYVLTAVATNTSGLSTTSEPVNVEIQPSASLFLISSQPANQAVPVGGSATFSVTVGGTNHVTYQWSFDGNAISGANSSTLVLPPPIVDGDAGTYSVTITAPGTTLASDPAVLTVIDAPIITTQPAGVAVSPGTDVTLDVIAGGTGPFTYQWQLNGNNIPGATGSSYFIPAAQPRQSGNYQVVVANAAASVVSDQALVIVETAITIPGTNNSFADRTSINPLTGSVSARNTLATVQPGAPLPDNLPGGNSVWFTWTPTFTGTVSMTTQGSDFDTVMAVYTGTQLNKLKVVAADDDSGGYLTSLVTFNVTAGTAYQIAVDGYQGAAGRIVLGLPAGTGYRALNPSSGASVPVIVKGPVSETVASGARVSFSVQPSSTTGFTCQWYFQGVPIPGATGTTFTISHVLPSSVGLYDVLVANAAGSAQSQLVSLQISSNLGGKATSSGSKFQNTTNAASPKSLAVRLRPLALGGDTGGFSVSQVFSTVGAGTEPGEPQPCGQSGSGSAWFVYTAPGAGMLQVSTEGSTFNTILGVYTGSGESFAGLTEAACGYATNYATEGQPSLTIPSVAKGTTFFLLIQGYQGATGVAQLQIGLGQPLNFRDFPSSQIVTAGNNATFAALAIGGTPLSYQWQLNGANLPGATKSTYTVKGAQNTSVGNYTVVASNIVGAITSSPPAILNVQYAPMILAGPSNLTVKLGQPAKFSVETLGVNVKTNPFVCQWFFNGAPIFKATGLTLSLPPTHWTNGGDYSLVISNSYGSVTSSPALLTIIDNTKPAIVIASPRANSTTTNNMVTVAGTASDPIGITRSFVELGTNGFEAAPGKTNWSITIGPLLPGANLISAETEDLSGVFSAIVKRTITFADPGPAFKSPRDPADRPLSSAAGTYSGLFYPATGATRESSGFFRATVASGFSGDFTANILLDGGSYSTTGKFDASGDAQSVVLRAGKPPVTASLHLDLGASNAQMTGVMSDGDWRSVLQAGRSVFNAATNPAPDHGSQFALVIPAGTNAPAGYLTINTNADGTALVTGTLADGANIFRAEPVEKGPAIPLYAPLYSGQGVFLAWIAFTNSPAQANYGHAVWIGPGFTNVTDVYIVK